MKRTLLDSLDAFKLAQMGEFKKLYASYVSENFKWEEVFKHCTDGEVKAAKFDIYENAQRHAQVMETVRRFFGNVPITVSSWYRSPARNAKIPGASMGSMHLYALATDFTVAGYVGSAGCLLAQKKLHTAPFMKLRGLEWTGGNWCHVDSRPEHIGKKYGYRFSANKR